MPDTDQTQDERLPRVFQIGSVTIHEDDSLRELSLDEIKTILAHQYPQVLNATHLETTEHGRQVIAFTPRAGTKG